MDRIISRGRATVKVFIRLKIPQRLLPLMEKMFKRTLTRMGRNRNISNLLLNVLLGIRSKYSGVMD